MGFDDITRGLRDRERRRILEELLAHNPVDLSDTLTDGAGRAQDSHAIALAHTHLPMLDDMGYVVWNRESETVVKGPNWEEIEPVVRLLSENEERIPEDTF